MSKPPERIRSGDEFQSRGNRLLERFPRAGTRSPQQGLEFGERLFDGREIRRVGRQKQQATAASFNGLLDPRSQVDRKVIQHHNLSWAQAGSQELLDID